MTCPCRATEYALMENAKRGKRIAELEECLLTAEERLKQMTRERDAERRTFANAADAMGCEPEDGDDFVEAVKELTRERDDAREQLYLTKAELGRWVDRETKAVRERDEARAETARMKARPSEAEIGRLDVMWQQLVRERDEARAEVSRLQEDRDKWRDRYHAMRTDVGLSGDVEDEITCAYRRGAEAMREACARWMSEREGISQWVYDDALSALPIPEEP